MQNDAKIKEFLKTVEDKRSKLGTRPKSAWRSNGVVTVEGTMVNINTINSTAQIVSIVSNLMANQHFKAEAAKFLGLEDFKDSALDDQLADMKLRASILQWEVDKRKLGLLEDKLKALRSEDAKTADALDDILGELS